MENWAVWEDEGIVPRMKKSWFVATLKLDLCSLLKRHSLGAMTLELRDSRGCSKTMETSSSKEKLQGKKKDESFSSIVSITLPFWKIMVILDLALPASHDDPIEKFLFTAVMYCPSHCNIPGQSLLEYKCLL